MKTYFHRMGLFALFLVVPASVAYGFGRGGFGGFRGGGFGGFRAGGYGGFRSADWGGYREGSFDRGSFSGYRSGNSVWTDRGWGATSSYDRGWSGERGGSINVSGTRGAATGPGGAVAGGTRDVTATGPGGRTYSSASRAGAAVGPGGAVAGGSRVGVATGPGGTITGGSRWGAAATRFPTDFGLAHYSTAAVGSFAHPTAYWSSSYVAARAGYVRAGFYHYGAFYPGWYAAHPLAWTAAGWGCPWLPADTDARTVFIYDLGRKAWTDAWRFPDAVSDLDIHPEGESVLVSCWDGKVYLLGRDGAIQEQVSLHQPARVRWASNGRFAIVGTQAGEVVSLDARGKVRWKTVLPHTALPPRTEPLRPVFAGVPIYSVGRVGTEHAYVGDIWLIKTREGGILVDTGGTSGLPFTWQRMKAAGIDPKDVRYVLLTHSHGDHAGATYLWRTQGAKIVAPATAALGVTWLMPTWSDYSIWVPSRIDQPLPLQRAGDETELTLCGLRIKAIFVPGHSFDSVLYAMAFDGKRVLFTGDLGFEGVSNILHRCWGDREKAWVVTRVVRRQVLPLKPDHVLTGHGPRPQGMAFLQDLLQRTEEALGASPGPK